MDTTWGNLKISDAHVHLFSHSFLSKLGPSVEETTRQLGWNTPPVEPAELAKAWLHEMERASVDRIALIGSSPGEEAAVTAARKVAPERFHAFCMVDPTAEHAIDRARDGLAAGIRGLCFFPAMHRYSMHDDRVRPLLELAAAVPGAVAFFHCGVLSVGVRKKLGLKSNFDMRFSNPLDLHALALRFDTLPFIIPHFGAGMFREALMVCDLCPNVYLDTSSTNSWTRYLLPAATLADIFERALEVVGPGRLLFGTDSSFFPRGWNRAIFDTQAAILNRLGTSAESAAAIFGGNLERLMGTSSPANP